MSELTTVRVRSLPGEQHDVEALVAELRSVLGEASVVVTSPAAFSGVAEVVLLLSGVAAAIKQVAPVIQAWLTRHSSKKLKTKQIDITGYSADELLQILDKLDNE